MALSNKGAQVQTSTAVAVIMAVKTQRRCLRNISAIFESLREGHIGDISNSVRESHPQYRQSQREVWYVSNGL